MAPPPGGQHLCRALNVARELPADTIMDLQQSLAGGLEGRYELDGELGRGGMATVFRARDVRHDRLVALKVMHPELAVSIGRERFLREIRVAAGLQHPNIVSVHDSGDVDGLLFYVMPLVEGETLRNRLSRESRLPVADALRIAREVADALGYAHARGIVHRDVKPENILLATSGHAMVADFGIARAAEVAREDQLTATGTSLGTPAYMAPEQALAEGADARADVWALGCVIHEMLAGAPPFGRDARQVLTRALNQPAPPLRALRPDVPRSVETAVRRALSRRPEERFPSAAELGLALYAGDAGGWNKPPSIPRRATLLVAALLLVAILVPEVRQAAARHRAGAAAMTAEARPSTDSLANELVREAATLPRRRTAEDNARAFDLFSRAIARDSNFAAAWAGLARAAQLAYIRGFASRGLSPDSLLALGVRASRRAVDLDPRDPATWIASARVAQIVDPGDRAAVISALRRALDLDSASAASSDAWFELGLAHQELLQDSLAESDWQRAIKLNPANTQALAFLALHYVWTGAAARGAPFADSAVALDPVLVTAREAALAVAFESGRLDDAERQAEALQRSAVGQSQEIALTGLARVRLGRGDTAAARTVVDQAIAAADPRAPARHQATYIAAALAALGDTAAAVRWREAFQPRADLHFQLHMKRDPWLHWIHGHWGKVVLAPDPS